MGHNSHSEEIHLPPPSIAPLVVAGGITFTLLGILSSSMLVLGIILLVAGVGLWIFAPA